MQKRGQFYLVAAIILSGIIISIAIITNTSSAKGNSATEMNNLRQELKTESAKTTDYAINNSLTQGQTDTLLENFSQNYIDSEKDKNLYFLIGDQQGINVMGWQANAYNVYVDGNFITGSQGQFSKAITPSGTTIDIVINGNTYIAGLKSGENFYFIASKEVNGENYVITS